MDAGLDARGGAVASGAARAWAADDVQDANQLVEKAKLSVDEFQKDPNMEGFRELAKKAHGMLILPQMIRGAFIIGASGGSGVLVARGAPGEPWKGPAFYTLGGRASASRPAVTWPRSSSWR